MLRDLTRFERPPLELVDAQPFDLASNFAPSPRPLGRRQHPRRSRSPAAPGVVRDPVRPGRDGSDRWTTRHRDRDWTSV